MKVAIDTHVDTIKSELTAKIPDHEGRAAVLAALELLRIFLQDVSRIAEELA